MVEVFLTELQKTAVDSVRCVHTKGEYSMMTPFSLQISSPVSMVLLEPCCLLLGSTKE